MRACRFLIEIASNNGLHESCLNEFANGFVSSWLRSREGRKYNVYYIHIDDEDFAAPFNEVQKEYFIKRSNELAKQLGIDYEIKYGEIRDSIESMDEDEDVHEKIWEATETAGFKDAKEILWDPPRQYEYDYDRRIITRPGTDLLSTVAFKAYSTNYRDKNKQYLKELKEYLDMLDLKMTYQMINAGMLEYDDNGELVPTPSFIEKGRRY